MTALRRTGPGVEVAGHGNLLAALTGALIAQRVVAADLRVEQPGLEDAFVALTGHRAELEETVR